MNNTICAFDLTLKNPIFKRFIFTPLACDKDVVVRCERGDILVLPCTPTVSFLFLWGTRKPRSYDNHKKH